MSNLAVPEPASEVRPDYVAFLANKVTHAAPSGFPCDPDDVNPLLKPHQRACAAWAVRGGRRALFEAFGLGKSMQQLECCRLVLAKGTLRRGLVVCPLGVRQEFLNDAAKLRTGDDPAFTNARRAALAAWQAASPDRLLPMPVFVRTTQEVQDHEAHASCEGPFLYLTNFESIREGKLDPRLFDCVSLDEADCLRSFGSKTFGEFVFGPLITIPYRFVATATPSPNQYLELIAYAHFLGIMDMGEAKTRFFKRNSEKAHDLTILPHKEDEFWLWVATWAMFLQRPSDLGPGFSDEGYTLPELKVVWHEVPVDHTSAPPVTAAKRGQQRLFRESMNSVSDAAREKRDSLSARVEKLREIVAPPSTCPECNGEGIHHFINKHAQCEQCAGTGKVGDPSHWLIWHDLEAERRAIEQAIPGVVSVYGNQDLDEREQLISQFSRGECQHLAAKPVMAGAGCNFQRHCHKAVFLGIGFKFRDFIQAIHRIQRFLQTHQVEIHIIYAESERSVRDILLEKWQRHNEMTERMSVIIREHGLASSSLSGLTRSMGVARQETREDLFWLINNDAVAEMPRHSENSVHLVTTSVPFSTQYEYTPNFADFGHTDSEDHFFAQMDYLTPELYRVLCPGRFAVIHCKDRVIPGGMSGLGFQTIGPFHCQLLMHYLKHGFAYMGMVTICTDVVRESNQTYRLGWSEICKDGTKTGVGMPEYLLLFRKPPSDCSNSYADEPVRKARKKWFAEGETDDDGALVLEDGWRNPEGYSRARWQIDADGFHRSSGNRLLMPEELTGLPWKQVYRLFRAFSATHIYDHSHHVAIAEALQAANALPRDFALIPARSWHPDVWSDITRMRSLNSAQSAKGKKLHLCPLPFDIVDRAIERYTMPGETVLDPFAGIGTVPLRALQLGRRGIGVELNPGYYLDAVAYCRNAAANHATPSLFDLLEDDPCEDDDLPDTAHEEQP